MSYTKYKNPWAAKSKHYSPAFYDTNVEPVDHRGYLIFERIPMQADIVKNGVCIAQRGIKGAKGFIDKIHDQPDDWFVQRALSNLHGD